MDQWLSKTHLINWMNSSALIVLRFSVLYRQKWVFPKWSMESFPMLYPLCPTHRIVSIIDVLQPPLHEILKHSSLLLHRLTFPSAQISPYIDPCESFSILRVIHLVGTSTFTYLSVTCNLSPICIPTQPSLSLPINLVINLVCFKIKYLLLFWKVGTELGNYDHVSLCLLQQCLAHSRWRGNSVLFIEGWIKTCIYVNTCPDIFSHS